MASKYRLLSVENDAKTVKGSKYGYLTGVLYLSPGKEADGIHNTCPMASPECLDLCLFRAGRAEFTPSIIQARVNRTLRYFSNPAEFIADLESDICKLQKEAKSRGLIPAIRINGTSDIAKLAMELADRHRDVQFYDYTKLGKPWLRVRANYHLTFSHSGHNLVQCIQALEHGINVAVVFSGSLPETWNGYKVVNGDESDLRFLDAKGVVVGLKLKGNGQKKRASLGGFVQIGVAA